jgi:hypothetical protein
MASLVPDSVEALRSAGGESLGLEGQVVSKVVSLQIYLGDTAGPQGELEPSLRDGKNRLQLDSANSTKVRSLYNRCRASAVRRRGRRLGRPADAPWQGSCQAHGACPRQF